MRTIILIAHNLRSCHNVGSLLRTADGLGVSQVLLTGYSPYPLVPDVSAIADGRLPHEAQNVQKRIHKTALGAEITQPWKHKADIHTVLDELRTAGYSLIAIEQTPNSTRLPDFVPPDKIALLVGREVEGVEPDILDLMDGTVEIPMFGSKESFNVVQAAAMALYHCRFSV